MFYKSSPWFTSPVHGLQVQSMVYKSSPIQRPVHVLQHAGKLSVEWNGQENFSLSCELWVGTNDFKTQKNFLVCSNPRIIFLSGN